MMAVVNRSILLDVQQFALQRCDRECTQVAHLLEDQHCRGSIAEALADLLQIIGIVVVQHLPRIDADLEQLVAIRYDLVAVDSRYLRQEVQHVVVLGRQSLQPILHQAYHFLDVLSFLELACQRLLNVLALQIKLRQILGTVDAERA
jgi:hypothetical protein